MDSKDDLGPVKEFFDKDKMKEDEHKKETKTEPKKAEEVPKQKETVIKGHSVDEPMKKEEDDEISIDFSKVKRWMKKGTSIDNRDHKKVHTPKKKEKKEAKLPDFSWIRSKETKENAKKFATFLIKYQILFLLLIPIITSVHIRSIPLDLPITDEWAQTSLNNQIRAQVSNQVIAQYPNLPDAKKNELIDEQVGKFIEDNREQYDGQRAELSKQFKQRFMTEDQQVYLPNIDPYYYARHARSLVEKGHVGDYLNEDGIPMNSHQTAPIDTPAERHFHMYFMAWIVKFVTFFNSDAGFLTTLAWIPVLVATLAIIPAFFIARRFGGNVAGFFAAMILAVNHSLLGRTSAGVVDTDAYTVTFPLMVMWTFLLAFEAETAKRKIIYSTITGALLAFFSFAWSGWWYIFDFLLAVLGVYVVYVVAARWKELTKDIKTVIWNTQTKGAALVTAILVPTTLVMTIAVQTFRSFSFEKGVSIALGSFSMPLKIISLKEAIRTNLWPNVLTTVAELNPGNLGSVTGGVGGKLMLFIALMGLSFALVRIEKMRGEDWLYLLVSAIWYGATLRYTTEILSFIMLATIPLIIRIVLLIKEGEIINIKYSVLLMVWMISTIYAVSKGLRFTILVIPAFALGFGTAAGAIFRTAPYVKKWFRIPQWVMKPAYLLLFLLLIIPPTMAGADIAAREVPIISDAWWQSLEAVKDNTQPDAIITSWWDFGHWFKFIADRPTTFDGAAQDRPQAHWVGKALLTNDEKEAVGIVRMLDCSADTGFNEIYDEVHRINAVARSGVEPAKSTGQRNFDTMDFLETIDLVNEVLVLDRAEAKEVYDQHFDTAKSDAFIELTHCQPPEAIYITSGDMIGKSGVWGHFGSWNFTRAALIDYARKGNETGFAQVLKRDNTNITQEQIDDYFNEVEGVWEAGSANNWIAPWPSYAGGIAGCATQGDTVRCANGVTVDLKTMNATVTTQNAIGSPQSLVYVKGDQVIEKTLEPEAQISVVLIPNNNGYASILVQHPMGASMFNRLFYMEGHGLTHFEKLYDAMAINGQRVLTWKIDWAGESQIIVDRWANMTSAQNTLKSNMTSSNLTTEEIVLSEAPSNETEEMIEEGPKDLANTSEASDAK